jgi:hypothetical protein
MIWRNAISYLDAWVNSNDRKPLVLRGARQVGKTSLVNDFSKNFDVFLSLNLERKSDALLFDRNKDTQQILDNIFLHCKQKKKKGKVLLFIDEIQNAPDAVLLLRYFYEDLPDLYVIAAGSLLESLIEKNISFPVGRVEYLAIRPFSFVEFLEGIGELFDSELVAEINADAVHERIINLFYVFCIVGGMPAAVVKYSQNRDILAIDSTYESLLASYIDDVQKYARNDSMATIISYIISNGLSHVASRITFERFNNSNYKSREVGEAFRTLEKTMLLELVYPTSNSKLPLQTSSSKKSKLIWLDVGLVNYFAGIRDSLFSISDITDSWRGKIAEQVVAQELISTKWQVSAKRVFWERNALNSISEVDFLYQYKGLVLPIEVKSGHNAKLKSLHYYIDSAPHNIAVRVWSGKFSIDKVTTFSGKEFNLINLPFYYVCVLDKILERFV